MCLWGRGWGVWYGDEQFSGLIVADRCRETKGFRLAEFWMACLKLDVDYEQTNWRFLDMVGVEEWFGVVKHCLDSD